MFEYTDFPGVVRAIALFEEIEDDISIDFHLSENSVAFACHVSNEDQIIGNPFQLEKHCFEWEDFLFVAAHEVGHVKGKHSRRSWKHYTIGRKMWLSACLYSLIGICMVMWGYIASNLTFEICGLVVLVFALLMKSIAIMYSNLYFSFIKRKIEIEADIACLPYVSLQKILEWVNPEEKWWSRKPSRSILRKALKNASSIYFFCCMRKLLW